MPDWLLTRPTIITLAIVGAVISMLGSWCHSRGMLTEQHVYWLNKLSYACMIVSIILFIGAGFFNANS